METLLRSAWACASVAAIATSALADEPPNNDADTLFHAGREAMRRGDYATACARFASSQSLDPAIGTTLNLARCLAKQGRSAEARREVQRLLGDARLDERRRAMALRISSELEQVAPTASSAPAPVASAPPPPARRPEPSQRAGAASPAHRSTRPATPARTVAGYAVGSLGLASLVTSAIVGYLALRSKDTVDEHCDAKGCDPQGLRAASRTLKLGDAATVALTAGIVATGAGTYLILTAPAVDPRRSTPSASDFGIAIRVRF
jgi:tetratricopeptide (TPR) repeat protein